MSDQRVLAEDTTDDFQEVNKVATVTASTPTSADRFAGNGVLFKAKLFGTADVNEPRGDNVCNTAIAMLKTAVKSTGEHKQKIFLRINYTGIILLDAVNQLKLYEHPVHKISFISKDPQDSRAFGYIVSEKETKKHTYFGIKTEKTADPVVMALRDMFQSVFDLKKKEAEMKGESVEKTTTTQTPASEKKAEQTATPTAPTTEPKLGDEADASKANSKQAAVKNENSSSHLLELLGDLSFVEPTPQAANPWPPQTAASASWGNAVPAQNDPFAAQPQPNLFVQQGQSPGMAFNQQPVPQAQFNPNAQPPFTQQFPQQQQPMFGNQPTQMFSPPAGQNMFGAVPQQQAMFQQPQQQQAMFRQPQQQQAMFQQQPRAPFTQQPAPGQASPFAQQPAPGQASPFAQQPVPGQASPFAQQPAPGQASPFAQQPAPGQASPFAQQPVPGQASPFTNDPFATNGFQQTAPQSNISGQGANNPFASPAGSAFGVLQPQQVAPPAQSTPFGQPQAQQSKNLFSELNPLPPSIQPVGKDKFFSDVKNPPKPKLNEMQQQATPPAEPAVDITSNNTATPQNYDWLNQLVAPNPVPASSSGVTTQQSGLIAPPPNHVRPRPGQAPLVKPM